MANGYINIPGGGSGGGATIGDAVTGGTANRVLYIDGSGNLADNANFLFTSGTRLALPIGSAAAVSITESGNNDNNTGLYFSGAGSAIGLAISYDGVRQSKWDGNGLDFSNVAGFATLTFNGTDSAYIAPNYFASAVNFAANNGLTFGRLGANTQTFVSANLATSGAVVGGLTNGAAYSTPNYEFDVRGGAGNATIQLSNTASGNTSGDGVLFDFDGTDLIIDNQEGGKVLLTGALGVGNSAAATVPGAVTNKIEIFDAAGTSLGFIAVYDAIV